MLNKAVVTLAACLMCSELYCLSLSSATFYNFCLITKRFNSFLAKKYASYHYLITVSLQDLAECDPLGGVPALEYWYIWTQEGIVYGVWDGL